MSHFARTRDPVAWVVGVVLPAEFASLDDKTFKAINGDEGGAWAPSAAIVIGGQGITLSNAVEFTPAGPTHVKFVDSSVVSVEANSAWSFKADSEVDFLNGAILSLAGTVGIQSTAVVEAYSGSVQRLTNGSTLNAQSGATVDIDSGVTFNVDSPLILTTAPATRTLLWQIKLAATGFVRMYARHSNSIPPISGGIEFTSNASWNGTQWVPDVAGALAMVYEFFEIPTNWSPLSSIDALFTTLQIRKKSTAPATWNQDAWDSDFTGLSAGTPTATFTGLPANTIYATTFAKAWGRIATDGAGGVTIKKGLGLASAVVSGGEVLVTLRHAMADTDYDVNVGMYGVNKVPHVQSVVSTTQFRIGWSDFAGGGVDPMTNVCEASFEVKGDQS